MAVREDALANFTIGKGYFDPSASLRKKYPRRRLL